MDVGSYIKQLRTNKGISQEELGKVVGVQRAAVQKWETGQVQNLKRETIKKLADYFNVSPSSFIVEQSNIVFIDDVKLYNAPLFESVSAGLGAAAVNEIIGYVPVTVSSYQDAQNIICIKVKGDSMSPLIDDGSIIQMRKQSSVDNNDIAVVLLDDMDGFVKKVEYGKDYIRLISINPNYPPIVLKGEDVQRCRIEGRVQRVIKDI